VFLVIHFCYVLLFPTSGTSPVSAACQDDVSAHQIHVYMTAVTAAAQTLLSSIYQNTNGHLHAATEIF